MKISVKPSKIRQNLVKTGKTCFNRLTSVKLGYGKIVELGNHLKDTTKVMSASRLKAQYSFDIDWGERIDFSLEPTAGPSGQSGRTSNRKRDESMSRLHDSVFIFFPLRFVSVAIGAAHAPTDGLSSYSHHPLAIKPISVPPFSPRPDIGDDHRSVVESNASLH